MIHQQSWSIIVLCYNEEFSVEKVVISIIEIFKKENLMQYEIIIVNDGSTDSSKREIEKLKLNYFDKIIGIHHPENLGIGATLISGYKAAKMENVCAVPADGQFDFNELIPYLNFEPSTIISFYRKENVAYTNFRNFLSKINKKINGYFNGLRLKDVNWVKAYKTNEINSFSWVIRSSLIESELCAKLILKGNSVIEIVSVYHPREFGKSKGASLKIVLQALIETLKLINAVRKFKNRL